MQWTIGIFSLILLGVLSGCGARPNVAIVPSDKVTQTTTVTTKRVHFVPAYDQQTSTTQQTQTKTSDGKPAAPLHSATITDGLPGNTFSPEKK